MPPIDPATTPAPRSPAMRFSSVGEFYPYYLGEHRNGVCRALHVIGSLTVLALIATAIVARDPWLLLATPIAGYGFAWIGHFGFEKNKPATFQYPFLSLACDWLMLAEILTLRLPLLGDLPAGRWKALRQRQIEGST